MNTGNYIYDYIYELVEDKYITKQKAMMYDDGFHKQKRLDDNEYKDLVLFINMTYGEN